MMDGHGVVDITMQLGLRRWHRAMAVGDPVAAAKAIAALEVAGISDQDLTAMESMVLALAARRLGI
jgi:hypothetical protein